MATFQCRPCSSTLRYGNDGTVLSGRMHRSAPVSAPASARARRVVPRRNGRVVGVDILLQLILGPSEKDTDVVNGTFNG